MATKIEILHANLAHNLHCIIDPADNYSTTLNLVQKPKFEQYITSLIDLVNQNEILKDSNKPPITLYEFDGSNDEIFKSDTILDEFEREFPSYPVKRGNIVRLICIIIEKIKLLHGNDDEITGGILRKLLIIYHNKFVIPKINFFFHIENSSVSQSLTLISNLTIKNQELRSDFFNELPNNLEFLFHFLWSIEKTFIFDKSQYLILKKTPTKPKSFNSVIAFVKLKLVSKGDEIHTPYHTSILPSLPPNFSLKMTENFQQFDDIINILSEYNARKDDILDKYLKLYHVIENFMFRYPVCKLYNSSDRSFTVRDFRNIYKKVETSEPEALLEFLRVTFNVEYAPTILVKNHIYNEWVNFRNANATKMPAIYSTLSKTGVSDVISDVAKINQGNFSDYYAQIIYKTRNAIVHNKDTEHHFIISKLPSEVPLYIEKFLLPTLEKIIYKLIETRNPIITYKNQNIKMW